MASKCTCNECAQVTVRHSATTNREKMNAMLAGLNAAAPAQFVATLGGVFEHSPWVAERALSLRPFGDIDALHAAMLGAVTAATRDVQLAQVQHAWTQLVSHTHTDTVLVLAGDSAGAHLATSMVHALCEEPGGGSASRLPDVLCTISPWLDVVPDPSKPPSPTRLRNARRGSDYVTPRLLAIFSRLANHGSNHMLPPDPDEPPVSETGAIAGATSGPYGALLEGRPLRRPWPTTGIWVGGGELLADDGRRLAAALSRSCFPSPTAAPSNSPLIGRTHKPYLPARRSASPTRLARSGGADVPLATTPRRGDELPGRRVQLFDQNDGVHDWLLLPLFDVRYGDSARAMDTLVDFVCDACREVLGGEAGHLVHC